MERVVLTLLMLSWTACSLERVPATPQPVYPSASAYTGRNGQSVMFRWREVSDLERDFLYEIQVSRSWDFSSIDQERTGLDSSSVLLTFSLRDTIPRGDRYFWRVRACSETVGCSSYSPARVLYVGRAERDFNGDGYSDVIVGAPGTASIYIYFGDASGLSSSPAGVLVGDKISGFGTVASWAGDLNDDGFGDIAVGVPRDWVGRVLIYLGGPGASFIPSAPWPTGGGQLETIGSSVAHAGDVNGDGISDLIVGGFEGVYLYLGVYGEPRFGSPSLTLDGKPREGLGVTVAGAGDVDNDGLSDVLIGVYVDNQQRPGHFYIYFGDRERGLRAEPLRRDGQMERDLFGDEFATTGDVDQDGASDLIISAVGVGSAYLDLGHTRLPLPSQMGAFGSAVSAGGDINGDGYADFLVGNPDFNQRAGSVHIFWGGTSLLQSSQRLEIAMANERFGSAVAPVGDINGDGYSDFAVGAPDAERGMGRAYIYYGSAGVIGGPGSILRGVAPDERLGTHVGR